MYGALRSGASGFLVKDMAVDDILAAVRVVAAGDALIAPGVTRRLIEEFAARPEPAGPRSGRTRPGRAEPAASLPPRALAGVTAREREVLVLIGRGLSDGEIAERLHISAATAKAHVARLFTELDARDRVQPVILAYEAGLAP